MAKPKGLYKIAYRPKQAPNSSKPYCIYNIETGDINGRWHATRAEALQQLKAMYVNMGSKAVKMNSEKSYLIPLKEFADVGKLKWINRNEMWVQQYPFDTWTHPYFSDTTIGPDEAKRLKESFDSNIKGQKIYADYEHGQDPAKGKKASGDIVELKVVENPYDIFSQPGLWARVKFTDVAKHEIEEGEWNYWSTSHWDSWTHPQTNETHELVYDGGGLTNKPHVKGMVPLNFSELGYSDEEAKQFAVWTTAYMNDLPDSSFLYIEPGGKKDSGGKTMPRSKRHLPVKDANGKIDLPHLRNAIARAPQTTSIPMAIRKRVQARAQRMLGSKNNAEAEAILELPLDEEPMTDETTETEEGTDEGNDNDTGESTEEAGESGDQEESDEEGENVEGGESEVALDKELREKLGLSADTDLVAHVAQMNDELAPMREALKAHGEKKDFAELFPQQYKEMERLMAESRESAAKKFSESFKETRLTRKDGENDEPTTLGYSGLVIQKIEETAKKFSEGDVTVDDFKDVLDTIAKNGIVDYGNTGSSKDDERFFNEVDEVKPGNIAEVRKQFAEKVTGIMQEDEVDRLTAVKLAADKYPKLAEAYQSAGMG
jgi:hypothetical protein